MSDDLMTDMFAGHNEKTDKSRSELVQAVSTIARSRHSNGDEITHLYLRSLPDPEGIIQDVIKEVEGNGNSNLLAIYNGQFQEDQALNNEMDQQDEVEDLNIKNDDLDAKLLAALNSAKNMIINYVAHCLERGVEVELSVINDLVGSVYASNQSNIDIAADNDHVKEFKDIQNQFKSFSNMNQENLSKGLSSAFKNDQADFDQVMNVFKDSSNKVSVSRTGEKQITLDDVSEEQMEKITQMLSEEGVEAGGNSIAPNAKPSRDHQI